MNPATENDRIERSVLIQAPRARVWRAIANAEEFGTWFGVDLRNQVFAAGRRTRGRITFPGYEHIVFDVLVELIEPPSRLSFRWHPFPNDPHADYSKEEPTLVTFTLEDAPGPATLLRITETGFDKVPLQRRLEAFRMNSRGWDGQLQNIVRHVAS